MLHALALGRPFLASHAYYDDVFSGKYTEMSREVSKFREKLEKLTHARSLDTTQVEQSYKILHSSCIYLARQIGQYLTRILQIARKCTQNEAFLARSGYILARSCTNLAITACKNRVLNGRRARINGSCKVLQDSLQENPTWKFLHANVSFLQDLYILLARSIAISFLQDSSKH